MHRPRRLANRQCVTKIVLPIANPRNSAGAIQFLRNKARDLGLVPKNSVESAKIPTFRRFPPRITRLPFRKGRRSFASQLKS